MLAQGTAASTDCNGVPEKALLRPNCGWGCGWGVPLVVPPGVLTRLLLLCCGAAAAVLLLLLLLVLAVPRP